MTHETNQATPKISNVLPTSIWHSYSADKHFRTPTSAIKRTEASAINMVRLRRGKGLDIKMEMSQIESKRLEDREDESTLYSKDMMREFSLFIDNSMLEVKLTQKDVHSEKLLFNSKFIDAYMRLNHSEKQTIKQLSLMKTSEEIANTLLVSINTIKNHRKNIKQKLALHSRGEHSRFLYWIRGFVS